MPRPKQDTPAQLTPGWPNRRSDDPAAEGARRIALVLIDLIDIHGPRAVSRALRFQHGGIKKVVDGESWPSIQHLARLEGALGLGVWPGRERLYHRHDAPKLTMRINKLVNPRLEDGGVQPGDQPAGE